jgi:hypothetical protein
VSVSDSSVDRAFDLALGSLPLLVHDTPLSLDSQNLLDLADLFLNFTGYLFTGAFGFQIWVIA